MPISTSKEELELVIILKDAAYFAKTENSSP